MKTSSIFAAAAALACPCTAIIGGSDAGPLEFLSTVSIQSTGFFGNHLLCAGTIIGPSTVLTAASCCDGSSPSSLRIRYGSKDWTKGGEDASLTKIYMHPQYSTSTRDNNYCVLHTYKPFNLLVGPSAIALLSDTPADTYAGLPLRIAGWGVTSIQGREAVKQLQSATMKGIEGLKCHAQWGDRFPITKNMNCAEPTDRENQNISICGFDQGGPLMAEGELTLIGVASFFEQVPKVGVCTAVPNANVYSNVYAAREWISGLIK